MGSTQRAERIGRTYVRSNEPDAARWGKKPGVLGWRDAMRAVVINGEGSSAARSCHPCTDLAPRAHFEREGDVDLNSSHRRRSKLDEQGQGSGVTLDACSL